MSLTLSIDAQQDNSCQQVGLVISTPLLTQLPCQEAVCFGWLVGDPAMIGCPAFSTPQQPGYLDTSLLW